MKKIQEFNPEKEITPTILKKIEKYTKMDNFQPHYVMKISQAAGALCLWVRSLEDYAKALKIVGPKRAKKAAAEEALAKKVAFLNSLEVEFQKLQAKLQELEDTYNKTTSDMAAYKAELDSLQVKIDRGDKLISGLSGEKTRWEATLIDLDD